MPVVPFLAGHFGTYIIGHDSTVVGEVANRKSIGLETTRTGAQDHAFGLEKMDLFFIKAETGRTCNSAVFFDQMGDDDSLFDRDISLFDGVVKTLVIKRGFKKPPLFKFIDTGKGMSAICRV